MPDINSTIALAMSIIEHFGGKIIVAAGMVIVLAITGLTYLAERIFNRG